VLGYQRDGLVLSKVGGGVWGCEHLPTEYVPLVLAALAHYRDGTPFVYDAEAGRKFAAYMLSEIYG